MREKREIFEGVIQLRHPPRKSSWLKDILEDSKHWPFTRGWMFDDLGFAVFRDVCPDELASTKVFRVSPFRIGCFGDPRLGTFN